MTDASLCLGYLAADEFLGGEMSLDEARGGPGCYGEAGDAPRHVHAAGRRLGLRRAPGPHRGRHQGDNGGEGSRSQRVLAGGVRRGGADAGAASGQGDGTARGGRARRPGRVLRLGDAYVGLGVRPGPDRPDDARRGRPGPGRRRVRPTGERGRPRAGRPVRGPGEPGSAETPGPALQRPGAHPVDRTGRRPTARTR